MIAPKTISLLVLLFLSGICFSQNHIIDEINHKNAISFSNKNKDSVLFYAKKLQESTNYCRAMFGYYYEANDLYFQQRYKESEEHLIELLSKLDMGSARNYVYSPLFVGESYEECIEIVKLNAFRRLFYIKTNQNKFTEAYEYLLLRKNVIENLPKKDTYYLRNKIAVNRSMAQIKRSLGDYRESTDILLKAYTDISNINMDMNDLWYEKFTLEKAHILVNLGSNYMYMGESNPILLDSAEIYFDKGFEMTQHLDSTYAGNKESHYIRKGHLNLIRKDYETALVNLRKAESYYTPDTPQHGLMVLKTICFSNLNNFDSAVHLGKKFVKLHQANEADKASLVDIYNVLAKEYHKKNEIDSAYKYSELTLNEVRDFHDAQKAIGLRLKTDEFSDIETLNKEINEKRSRLKLQLIWLSVISGLLIVGLIIFFTMRRRKLNRKFKQIRDRYEELLNTAPKPKRPETKIDDQLAQEVLLGLSNLEVSDIYTDSDFSLAMLAKLLRTNTSYLSKIINTYKGKPFKQYLSELRINYLLKKIDEDPMFKKYSIKTLGEEIGYTNASAFTRAFKNHKGINPSEYIANKYV